MTTVQSWNDEAVQVAGDDTSGRCTNFRGGWLFGFERCDKPAEVVATYGCVHEHGGSLLLCAACAEGSADGLCNACTDGPESHDCPMKMTTKPVTA